MAMTKPPKRTMAEKRAIMKAAGVKIKPVKIVPPIPAPKPVSGKTLVQATALVGELMPPKEKKPFGGVRGRSGGRPTGSKNKIGREVKEVIAQCFVDIGGAKEFARWARDHRADFYKLYAKLLPIQLQTKGSTEVHITVSRDEADL